MVDLDDPSNAAQQRTKEVRFALASIVYPREVRSEDMTREQERKLFDYHSCMNGFTKKKLKVLLENRAMGTIFRAYAKSGCF